MHCLPDAPKYATLRLLIADDHAVVRQGLKHVFSLTGRMQVAGEASNGRQALDLLLTQTFDAALLDMNLPDINGLGLIMRIRSHKIDIPVVAFSMTDAPQVARLALQAGASSYLTKDCSPETLTAAVEQAVTHHQQARRRAEEACDAASAHSTQDTTHQSLSERERQIFRMLVSGKRINDIAEELAVSNKAVSTYKARLMQKMNFANNAELLCYGLAHGLRE